MNLFELEINNLRTLFITKENWQQRKIIKWHISYMLLALYPYSKQTGIMTLHTHFSFPILIQWFIFAIRIKIFLMLKIPTWFAHIQIRQNINAI